jgi:hypothetical protein
LTGFPLDTLWVVTSYFNPTRSARRHASYKLFRRELSAPLLTVELAGPGRHQLEQADAEILIQLNGEEFIWQKERLINLGVAALPSHVRHVAWVDCDVIFGCQDWVSAAQKELDCDGGLLHLFSRVVHLPEDHSAFSTRDALAAVTPLMTEASMGLAVTQGHGLEALQACYCQTSRRSHGNTWATGIALAAPRKLIERCGLYDEAIVGGGDAILMCAALNQLTLDMMGRQVNDAEFTRICEWAARADNVGLFSNFRHLEQTVYHLWHGKLKNRQYGRRHQITAGFGFNAARHLQCAANGTWLWAEPDGALAGAVRAYFRGRHEDGEPLRTCH